MTTTRNDPNGVLMSSALVFKRKTLSFCALTTGSVATSRMNWRTGAVRPRCSTQVCEISAGPVPAGSQLVGYQGSQDISLSAGPVPAGATIELART